MAPPRDGVVAPSPMTAPPSGPRATAEAAEPYGEPDLSPEPGWQPFEPWGPPRGGYPSFVGGTAGIERLQVRLFVAGDKSTVVGKAWFSEHAQGPPGLAHGGAIATVHDHALGLAVHRAGHRCMTARLNVQYRRPVPVDTVVRLEAKLVEAKGRKIFAEGKIVGPDGEVLSTADGLFIELRRPPW